MNDDDVTTAPGPTSKKVTNTTNDNDTDAQEQGDIPKVTQPRSKSGEPSLIMSWLRRQTYSRDRTINDCRADVCVATGQVNYSKTQG